MSYTVTVGGVAKHIRQETLSIDKAMTYEVYTCTCQIIDSTKPAEGDEIIVTDSVLGVLYGGIVVRVKLVDKDALAWELECNDYTELIDRKLVIETYSNQSASTIFSDILAKYVTADLIDAVSTGAPTVEYIQFNYMRPSECFKKLCDYVGWQWYVDDVKNVKFFEPTALMTPGPIALNSTTRGQWGDFQISVDTMGLRNKTYVIGGTMLSDPQTFEYVADGLQIVYNLGHKPHDLTMMVNAEAVTVGIENIDADDGSYEYMMNYQEKYVRNSTVTPPVAAGTTVAFTYKYDIPVITYDEDAASQAALALVQGGDGVYEHMITDDKLTTVEAAYAVAQKDLRDWANPKIAGSFETLEPGWAPGQILTVDLSDRGIQNDYMIQSVQLRYAADWFWRVNFGGRLIGIADFLQALVSSQQQATVSTSIISKIKSSVDTTEWSDTSVETLAELPYYVGDIDAICGFTEVNIGAALPDQPTAKTASDTLLVTLTETSNKVEVPAPTGAEDTYYMGRFMSAVGVGTVTNVNKSASDNLLVKLDEAVEGYWIYRKVSGGAYSIIAVVPLSVTAYQDDNVVAGTTYVYQVKKYQNGVWTQSNEDTETA
jgi:hypothetical protein